MKIYYSGGSGLESTPERLVALRKPCVMLTFYDVRKTGTKERFIAYLKRKSNAVKSREVSS